MNTQITEPNIINENMRNQKLTYTMREVAEVLNISVAHAYKLADQKAFPTLRLGKRILVSIKKLEEFINQ